MYSKIAIIDLGTNTFHLLLAEADRQGYHITYRERLAVKIGKGGINAGVITEEGIQRALLAMQSFRNTIAEEKVEKVFAFGTSALRNAVNKEDVLDRIQKLTGIEVKIIDGDQEAEYIYQGVRSALGLGTEKSLIIDIGGGSVEFIIADQHTIYWKQSKEMGAQRLLEKFQKNDPITKEEMLALDAYFEEQLVQLMDALTEWDCRILIGSSGTFDTLSDIFCARYNIYKTPEEIETPLSISGFYTIYDELVRKNRSERMLIPGMLEMRVDMIVVAVCLIRYIMANHRFDRIRVSTYSLKEGVLSALISEVKLEQ